MPISKKQLMRLIRLAAQLKENRYPNCTTFAEELCKADLRENLNLACTAKTIFRDIQTLKDDFAAPIKFDYKRNGYYLAHHGWTFSCPQIYDESEMLSAVLGARIAEHIFPDPLRQKIRDAVDYMLVYNNPDFLDKMQMDSLVVIPGNRTEIDADIFMPLFRAWQEHERCRILYADSRGCTTERDFEPHAMIFFEGIWYTKGFCCTRNEMRTLVVPRIKAIQPLKRFFETRTDITATVTVDAIFGAELVSNAVIHCDEYLTKFIETRPLHPEQLVTINPDGTSEIRIKSIPRYRLITWIMHQCGRAKLIEPASITETIRDFASKIEQLHK